MTVKKAIFSCVGSMILVCVGASTSSFAGGLDHDKKEQVQTQEKTNTQKAPNTQETPNTAALNGQANLTKLLSSIDTLSGDFKQVLSDKNGQVIQTSEGQFSLKRPGFFRWESAEPYPQLVMGNPTTLWVYDPDLEQVSVKTHDLNEASNPARLLSGDLEALAKHYRISESSVDNQRVFNLQPQKDASRSFTDIQFVFDADYLKTITFKDALGQATVLDLVNTVRNTPMKDDSFTFVIPEGTDVIRDE